MLFDTTFVFTDGGYAPNLMKIGELIKALRKYDHLGTTSKDTPLMLKIIPPTLYRLLELTPIEAFDELVKLVNRDNPSEPETPIWQWQIIADKHSWSPPSVEWEGNSISYSPAEWNKIRNVFQLRLKTKIPNVTYVLDGNSSEDSQPLEYLKLKNQPNHLGMKLTD